MQAQVDLTSGERLMLSGFSAVNRTKLKALSGDKIAELAKTDELELLYLHLQSMRNFSLLRDRVAVGPGKQSDSEPAPAVEAGAAATASNGSGAHQAASA